MPGRGFTKQMSKYLMLARIIRLLEKQTTKVTTTLSN
jgi:hypothetical protein